MRHLAEGVRRLREAGVAVVVGTCPDLGTIKPIAPPLKQVARSWSRRLAAAQTIAVVEAGGRTVVAGLDPRARSSPPPRRCCSGPTSSTPPPTATSSSPRCSSRPCLAELGLVPDDEALPEAYRGEGVLPVAAAAVEAVKTPGTELDGTEVSGSQRGLRGRWVELRHRRRHPGADVEAPEKSDPDAVEALEDVPARPVGTDRK